jgi:predicted aspartyl protease
MIEVEIFANENQFLRSKNDRDNEGDHPAHSLHRDSFRGRSREAGSRTRNPSPGIRTRMLVDTGSNISGLHRHLIETLQLPMYHEKARIEAAGGLVSLHRFRCVMYMDIFGQKALPLDIVEGDFEGAEYDGVIGRDVLQFCKLEFNGPGNSFRMSAPGF